MKQPVQIRFIGLEPSPAVEAAAREKAAKLDQFRPDLMACRVSNYWFGPDNLAGTPFDHVQVGAQVRFIPEVAGEGRQAKRVSLGKHHIE